MHEKTHRQSFKQRVAEVDQYLRSKFGDTLKSLSTRELKTYRPNHPFVRGWSFSDPDANIVYSVLIPEQFPYVTPRIAIADTATPDRNFGTELPHVEEHGLLCLPAIEPSSSDAVAVLNKMLKDAFKFVADYSDDPARVKAEFQREFISYWNRQRNGANILSLTDLSGETRKIFFGEGRDPYWITADSINDINRWYVNKHGTKKLPAIHNGLFIKLKEAPTPPYPQTPSEFDAFIEKHAPEVLDRFRINMLHPGPYLIVMSASSETGVGPMGMSFIMGEGAPNPFRGGFRGTAYMPMDTRKSRFNESYTLRRHQIIRVDHDWIHGRGADKTQEHLKKASVIILGCGALGSHVAVRLAQAGVGSLFLIDSELLESPNIGRHVLGMNNLLRPKVEGLTLEIRQRFPHVQAYGYHGKWEDALTKHVEDFESADLIVSAMASWGSEGALNEWQISRSAKPPILYGWTEPRAIASHALLFQVPGTCLHCVIDESGRMRAPETEGWPDEDGIMSEPACGAVFQPFGPVELANAEALAADLAISVLTGSRKQNCHMVHATVEDRVTELGGQWTDTHRKFRPKSFDGSFQYERPLSKHAGCPHCSKVI